MAFGILGRVGPVTSSDVPLSTAIERKRHGLGTRLRASSVKFQIDRRAHLALGITVTNYGDSALIAWDEHAGHGGV